MVARALWLPGLVLVCGVVGCSSGSHDLAALASRSEGGAVVPADAELVVTVDLRRGDELMMMPASRRDALMADLKDAMQRTLGFAPGEMRRAVVVVNTAREAAAAWVLGSAPTGAPKGETRQFGPLSAGELFPGTWLAPTSDGFVVGNEAGLAWVGEAPRGESPRAELHDSLVGDLNVSEPLVAASLVGGPAAALAKAQLGGEVVGAAAALGGSRIRGLVRGDAAVAGALETTLQGLVALGKAEVDKAAVKARTSEDPVEAILGVLTKHQGAMLLEAIEVERSGDTVQVGMDVPGLDSESGMVASAAIIGGLAAVAVPAFTKYMKRAKTSEAPAEMDRIYRAAERYYTTPRYAADGSRLPCAFPPSVGLTPSAGTCCAKLGGPDADGDGRCDGDAAAWDSPTWKALEFAPQGPHTFVYAFDSSGEGGEATFTVTAHADLDCDGIQSTFQRMAFGDPDAPAGECALRDTASKYTDLETE
ncbi:MAG: hypothetical protein H6744_17745 [Deltaproteobacteria bacterium]|nr:hypothetical protein [Deltaproteobacteria bacterium]